MVWLMVNCDQPMRPCRTPEHKLVNARVNDGHLRMPKSAKTCALRHVELQT
jgi:hypothetical protein